MSLIHFLRKWEQLRELASSFPHTTWPKQALCLPHLPVHEQPSLLAEADFSTWHWSLPTSSHPPPLSRSWLFPSASNLFEQPSSPVLRPATHCSAHQSQQNLMVLSTRRPLSAHLHISFLSQLTQWDCTRSLSRHIVCDFQDAKLNGCLSLFTWPPSSLVRADGSIFLHTLFLGFQDTPLPWLFCYLSDHSRFLWQFFLLNLTSNVGVSQASSLSILSA